MSKPMFGLMQLIHGMIKDNEGLSTVLHLHGYQKTLIRYHLWRYLRTIAAPYSIQGSMNPGAPIKQGG